MKSKINKIGIEIEGEFSKRLEEALELEGQMKHDGSVTPCQNISEFHRLHQEKNIHLSTREFASNAIEYENINKFNKIFDLFNKAYKEGHFHWNSSAGFHIHISFSPTKIPPEIRSTQFTTLAIEEIANKYPEIFVARTAGRYCQATELNKNSFLINPSSRYKAINFQSLQKHGTLEFRIWPSDNPEKMKEYFDFTINLIKKFLNKKTKTTIEHEIDLDKTMNRFYIERKHKKREKNELTYKESITKKKAYY